jgi:hypothetical protein
MTDMKATLIFEFDIDGKSPGLEIIEQAFLEKAAGSVITSESVDGTDNWAILLETVSVEIQA